MNAADKAFDARDYHRARNSYLLAAYTLVGDGGKIPMEATSNGGAAQWPTYINMDPYVKLYLICCYNLIGKSSKEVGNLEDALIWVEEARFVALTTRFTLEVPLFEWIRHHLELPPLTKQIVTSLVLASEIFEKLGNTGSAVDRRWNLGVEFMGARHMTPEVVALRDLKKLDRLTSLRHPDPKLTADLKVDHPELQVLGSWKKVYVKKKGPMKPRLAFSSFIWNGKLYVGGGLGETKGPCYRDLCCLDLVKLDTWRTLPPFPGPEGATGVWMLWNFAVYNDKAFLFTGKEELDYFDLRKEKWGTVMTYSLGEAAGPDMGPVFARAPLYNLKDTTQQVVGDHLYVFGGTHKKCMIGINLFMRLDFKTLTWKRLSGYFQPGKVADYSCPGPRKTPSSWVDANQERIYLFGGEADRSAGGMNGELHTASNGYAYEDFWSWDIKEEKWRMERLCGNVPCPRSEAACTFNPVTNTAIVFGGYNPALQTQFDNNVFPFSYFADTFVYAPSAPPSDNVGISWRNTKPASNSNGGKWKQVLTRGFPTYRAQSQLLSDPPTGKVYLFGGYVNTDWVPSGKVNASRTFCDLWELRLDLPGGDFANVDIEEEAKTAKIGPWQRCFACGSAGRWKKCGGSCKGKAFFCDSDCLADGWRQHKKMHHCRKID
ncbi:hypothetical protein GALMADRAFT_232263 [Galerina marginata CBS 339.88]|uniref:Uncharacterized protein n=1 Tax=Galerina marginata (strain CBS 339.88) TaxID=685588 RepID=A0A067S846_GALM3|nr:hypothetical protein GALMADRAFT_232263 [Galerina marginata CBS 339.88]